MRQLNRSARCRFLGAFLLVLAIPGCHAMSYNAEVARQDADQHVPAPLVWRVNPACMQDLGTPFVQTKCEDANRTDLIALGLSGGGTKATVFGGETLFYLQALGLLQRTSMISSVSGGSFAAALYALSCDERDSACLGEPVHGADRPSWSYGRIMATLGRGNRELVDEQIGRLILPGLGATISAHDFGRLIDRRFLHLDSEAPEQFTFRDLNPRRPALFLNATIVSENRAGLADAPNQAAVVGALSRAEPPDQAGKCPWNYSKNRHSLRRRTPDEFFHFSFTDQYFRFINSRYLDYPLGDAVAASAAFPALIEPALLTDFCKEEDEPRTIRLIDGGANDNQALLELYAELAQLVHGQHRSQARDPKQLLARARGDRAYVVLVNSSVTETTGTPGTAPDDRPHELVSFVIDLFDRITTATDTYSAVGYNLRKQLYQRELIGQPVGGKPAPSPYAPVFATEVSLTELDQYAVGGTEAALRVKSNIDVRRDGSLRPGWREEITDPAQPIIVERIRRQSAAYDKLVEDAAARRRLGLSDWHPQCYFDIRAELDRALSSVSEDDQACLREAARWATALRAQEMCGRDPPPGLDCGPDGVVRLQADGLRVLGNGAEKLRGHCAMDVRRNASAKGEIVHSAAPMPADDWKVQCRNLQQSPAAFVQASSDAPDLSGGGGPRPPASRLPAPRLPAPRLPAPGPPDR